MRVCHDDRDYYSYTEIPIDCISGDDSRSYNLVQAAHVGKAGSSLATDLAEAGMGRRSLSLLISWLIESLLCLLAPLVDLLDVS